MMGFLCVFSFIKVEKGYCRVGVGDGGALKILKDSSEAHRCVWL